MINIKKLLIGVITFAITLASFNAISIAILPDSINVQAYVDNNDWVFAAPPTIEANGLPYIAFTDLITGPDTGLGDGLGSGVIVTAWGYFLGSNQGDSTIEYCDSGDVCRAAEHVYYWKNADGALPSGPSNLYESHGMQEIAFSIPDSADGAGYIRVTVDSNYATSPFTVRAGNIYHVKASGNDSTGDGSWANPWATWNNGAKADINAPGATVYFDSVFLGGYNSDQVLHFNKTAISSSLAAQFMLVGYPNTRPEVAGYRGTTLYNDPVGFGVSKFSFFSANYTEGANGQLGSLLPGATNNQAIGISGISNGRLIANYVTDWHPSNPTKTCATGTQGAIKANSLYDDEVSNLFVLGNMIEGYGCYGSNKLHHTTYFSIRSAEGDEQLVAPTISYNYLKDNKTKNGLHFYDENNGGDECGDFTTLFKFTKNVVVNQAGSGVEVTASCNQTGDFLVEDNLFINTGLAAHWDGLDVSTSNGPNTAAISVEGGGWQLGSSVTVRRNISYIWNDDDQVADTQSCIGWGTTTTDATYVVEENVCWTNKDKPFSNIACCGAYVPTASLTMDNNAFYTTAGSPSNAVVPGYATNSITSDPLLTLNGSKISIDSNSPLVGQSSNSTGRDLYGRSRSSQTLGPVEPAPIEPQGIIFETNFDEDGAFYSGQRQATWTEIQAVKPEGFSGTRITGSGGYIQGIPGESPDGTPALRFMYDPALGQPNNNLLLHLTGEHDVGYDELYVRYTVKLPNGFKAGQPGVPLNYWKWGRLWQNTATEEPPLAGGGWTENRDDSGYVVWTFSGESNPNIAYCIRANAIYGANEGVNLNQGSAGGERYGANNGPSLNSDCATSQGVFGNVGSGAWEIDPSTRLLVNNSNQQWHTIEWRFKLASAPGANDGVFQMWFDGEEKFMTSFGTSTAPEIPGADPSLIPTAVFAPGTGYNFLSVFDNMSAWNKDWDEAGVEGGIYLADVVVSTDRITHDYVAKPYSQPNEIAKAFPGAEGVGTNTRGGAGGTVYKVTNLNDSGSGSFREAVTASGPRVVVFDVSGTIDLQSEILISNPYLTVAGQTSPNGVQIAGSRIRINTNDVIWRYMRHRVGDHRNTNELARCLGVYGNGSGLPNDAYNVVIDHSSFAWCSDQQLNAAEDAYDVTFSWNLLTEPMNTNNHGYNMFFWGRHTDIGRAYSVHHNYLANSTFRNPEINYTGRLDFVNNVAYNNVRGSMINVQWNSDNDSRDEIEINVVGNLNKFGPSTSDTNKGVVDFYQYTNDPGSNPIVYESGNIGGNDGTVNILTGTDTNPFQFWPTVAAGFSTGTPFTFSETITASTMNTAYAQYVIDNAGANVPARDFIDQRAHDDFDNDTGRIISSVTFPTDWPDLATGAPSAPADTDNDGMADAWETAEGLNVGTNDSTTVESGEVYTNIERYINALADGTWSN